MMVFFDLDGPLLDVSGKYYRAYVDLLANKGHDCLSKDEYWNCKRNRTPVQQILNRTHAGELFDWYINERKRIIESDTYFAYDRLQDKSIDVLEYLAKKHKLILCTLRSSSVQLNKELEHFNIKKYFAHLLVSGKELTPRWKMKVNLIMDEFPNAKNSKTVFIGDTETDIVAGQNLGSTTIGVLNGIRSYEMLEPLNADYLVNSVGEVLESGVF